MTTRRPLRLLLLILAIAGCASSQKAVDGGTDALTATITLGPALRHFADASSLSLDEFLNCYVLDRHSNTLYKLSPTGDSLRAASGYGHGHYQFNDPLDVDARLTNRIFVADNLNHRIEQYSKDLAYSSTFSTRDNPLSAERFGYPRAVASDDAGNLYVADGENKRVIKARPDFTFDRAIGSYNDATRPDAILTNPIDLAVDKEERLIVLDNGGTSLVAFDNLGNPLGRLRLLDPVHAIAVSNDTIFALNLAGTEIKLFKANDRSSSVAFTEQGRWKIVPSDPELPPLLMDVASRNGALFLLGRSGLYRCSVQPN